MIPGSHKVFILIQGFFKVGFRLLELTLDPEDFTHAVIGIRAIWCKIYRLPEITTTFLNIVIKAGLTN